MNRILLTQNGTIECNDRPLSTSALMVLNHEVLLSDSFTLRGYFMLLDRYEFLCEINEFLPAIRDQYGKCPAEGCIWPDFAHLEFAKTIELIGFPSEPRLEIYNTLRGKHNGADMEIRSLMLDQVLDIPVRLGKLKHIVFGDKVDVFEFDTVFTLFELIDGIAWELSFQTSSNACAIRR